MRNMASMACVCSVACASAPALAQAKGFVNYDGDTFRATFRLKNVDTPEMKGRCENEIRLAERAKNFTAAWLAQGRVTIRQTGIDKFGRVLVHVERIVKGTTEDLGNSLVAGGMARPWTGRRKSWC